MSEFLTSDNTKIYYDIQGSGKPVIFIHGFGARSNVFRIPQRILSKEFQTISYDLRGHGMSRDSGEEVSMELLARDLYEIIAYLGLDDVTLVGWSMGGSVIFEYIKNYGCKNLEGLAIVDTGPKLVNTSGWSLGLYKGAYDENQAKSALNLMMESWSHYSKNFMTKMGPNLDEKGLEIAIASMEGNEAKHMISVWKDLVSKDYRNILGKITIPTMIIMGGKSSLYSRSTGEYLKDNIKNSKLLIFEDNGHLLVQENPTKFSRALMDFIK
ncbi:alpha/beta hydrolase [Tissierella creatinini]|nr:alpha/beta hydrolase [Tissierella creatinini]TJX62240.1 alpha/beta hydrolase [Soehngenia saccharolytica]